MAAGINWKELTPEMVANMPAMSPVPTATPIASAKYDEKLIK